MRKCMDLHVYLVCLSQAYNDRVRQKKKGKIKAQIEVRTWLITHLSEKGELLPIQITLI